MIKRIYVALFVSMCCLQISYAQINFFTNQSDDSLTTDFYKRSLKTTAIVLGNSKTYDIGVSIFRHNSIDRISLYADFKINTQHRYVITGTEINGLGITQKKIPYRSFSCNIGIARAVTRNWFVYAAPGFVAQRSYFENTVGDAYSYTISKHGMWYNMTFGGLYVADNKLSVQAGMDIFNKNLQIGIGYTF